MRIRTAEIHRGSADLHGEVAASGSAATGV